MQPAPAAEKRTLLRRVCYDLIVFFFQAEDGIRDYKVTGVQTCALPISFLLIQRTLAKSRRCLAHAGLATSSLGTATFAVSIARTIKSHKCTKNSTKTK